MFHCEKQVKEISFHSIESPFSCIQQTPPGTGELNTMRTQAVSWLICLRIYIRRITFSTVSKEVTVSTSILILQCNFITFQSQYKKSHYLKIHQMWFDTAVLCDQNVFFNLVCGKIFIRPRLLTVCYYKLVLWAML